MDLDVLVTPALGDNSYLLASAGEAVVVDPQRDVERILAAAEAHGAPIRHVLETHVHNDYVSGAAEIRAATSAEIVVPAGGEYEFPARLVADGDEIHVGGLRLMAMATPGHTPEHLSYVVYEGDAATPVAVFTGGSLMVGGAGRTDLLGPELTDRLTRDQYRSLHRLAELPAEVRVLPTHGAGSFCGAAPAPKERTSTIREELARNRALKAPDEGSFVAQQLSGPLAHPTYFRSMATLNRRGPKLVSEILPPRPLDPEEVAKRRGDGVWVIDGRWRVPFARVHLPGSLNVELDDSFASYVGWVVPFGEPVILVLPDPQKESLHEAVTQLLRIGYERVEGYLEGGVEAWLAAGRPVDSYRVAGLHELCTSYRAGRVPHVLDVRQQPEWDAGSIPGSQHVFVGDLPARLSEVPSDGGEVWAICATGHRASIAASLLDRANVPVRLVEGTGVKDFLEHCLREDAQT